MRGVTERTKVGGRFEFGGDGARSRYSRGARSSRAGSLRGVLWGKGRGQGGA